MSIKLLITAIVTNEIRLDHWARGIDNFLRWEESAPTAPLSWVQPVATKGPRVLVRRLTKLRCGNGSMFDSRHITERRVGQAPLPISAPATSEFIFLATGWQRYFSGVTLASAEL